MQASHRKCKRSVLSFIGTRVVCPHITMAKVDWCGEKNSDSFKIFQHTSHNVGIFAKRFARIFLRLHQLQIDGKTVTIATESVDFMDLTDTNPGNNWYQFYTNYKWIGTKWKAYRLLVLSLDIDFVK